MFLTAAIGVKDWGYPQNNFRLLSCISYFGSECLQESRHTGISKHPQPFIDEWQSSKDFKLFNKFSMTL